MDRPPGTMLRIRRKPMRIRNFSLRRRTLRTPTFNIGTAR